MELAYYHGNITKEHCEELLSKNKNNGCFLIRDSESIPGVLCLCVFYEEFIYTYRIFRKHNGHFMIQTSEGVPKQDFRTLKDLIATFEKPNQGLIINLRYPINRSTSSQQPQNPCKFNGDYTNIGLLPAMYAYDYTCAGQFYVCLLRRKSYCIKCNIFPEPEGSDYVDVLPD